MGFTRNFGWITKNGYKKQCISLIWKVKAAVKKSMKKNNNHHKGKKQVRFHYDPSSYAMNFDDSSSSIFINGGFRGTEQSIDGEQNAIGYYYKLQIFLILAANSTLVYVFFIRF